MTVNHGVWKVRICIQAQMRFEVAVKFFFKNACKEVMKE